MKILKTQSELYQFLNPWRQADKTIGFVPTMGALHQGHLTLVQQAKKSADIIIASIFVNPTQFNDPKDLEKYPRTELADIQKLEEQNCDAVFIPSIQEMYQNNEQWHLEIGYLETILEGAIRPKHYQGVTQIVKKLFDAVQPTHAFFGQKDYQQFLIIKHLVAHFAMPICLHCVPTVREADGLAMSSRNVHLSLQERQTALSLSKILAQTQENYAKHTIQTLQSSAIAWLEQQKELQLEYFSILDAQTLCPISNKQSTQAIALVACKIGNTRLIDNILLS